jgi:hypothetical protein
MTIHDNSGNLDPISKFVHVRKALAAVALQVISMVNIIRWTHLISETATRSETGDGWYKQWIVNRHIDLETWNGVYNWE